jgi:hypothetical protein
MATQRRLDKENAERYIRSEFGADINTYLQWCRSRGLNETWEKTPFELGRESAIYKAERAIAALEKRRKGPKDVREELHTLCANMPRRGSEKYYHLDGMVRDPTTKACFLRLVDAAHANRTKILDDDNGVMTLARVAMWYPYWLNDVATWNPGSHSRRRQVSSLLRHMFAKYRVPAFMDSAWDHNHEIEQDWYVHIGSGKNIRTAAHLPFPMTKKMAHHFLEAPSDFSINEAFIHGMVMSCGGNIRISRALRGTKFVALKDEFRESFLRFLVANPMLDTNQYGPVLDYICFMKYEHRRVFENGIPVDIPPPQPNFSMTGRDAGTLMRQVERWHKELNKSKRGKKLSWQKSNIEDFFLSEGEVHTPSHRLWSVVELLDSSALLDEGRAMHHCVYSYTDSCAAGRCSIWSLRRYDNTGSWRLVTIEVSHGTIVQARGVNQRSPTVQEWRIIGLWVQKSKLTVASYVK